MTARTVVIGVAAVATICSIATVLIYLVTLDATLLSAWLEGPMFPGSPTTSVWLVVVTYLIFQFVFPAALGLGAAVLWASGYSHPRYGILVGTVFGIWASATFLIVPYCGAYTSLPAIMVGGALSGGTNTGVWYYGGILVTNVLFWIIVITMVYLIAPRNAWSA